MRSGLKAKDFFKTNFQRKKQIMFKVGLGGSCRNPTLTCNFNLSLSPFCSSAQQPRARRGPPRASAAVRTNAPAGDRPYLGELPTYVKRRRETGGGQREARRDGEKYLVLRSEAEQSLEQGRGFSNPNPSTQPKRGQGEPDLAGSRVPQAHGAPQGGWVQDQAPQP